MTAENTAASRVYRTTAKVHSFDANGLAIVQGNLPNGQEAQMQTAGATVELVDHNGSTHTHRFLNVEKAREIFGDFGVGDVIEITYTRISAPLNPGDPDAAVTEKDE